jgi:hypothetical protein
MSAEYLSASTVGRLAGVSRETVNYWVKRGLNGWKLPAVLCGGTYMIRRKDAERFLLMRSGRQLPAV